MHEVPSSEAGPAKFKIKKEIVSSTNNGDISKKKLAMVSYIVSKFKDTKSDKNQFLYYVERPEGDQNSKLTHWRFGLSY